MLPEAVGTVNTGSATELRHVICAYEEIMAWGPDVVHDHTLAGPVYAASLPLRVVTTNHGPFDSELGPLYRAICHHTAVVAISRHQASLASPRHPHRRHHPPRHGRRRGADRPWRR